MKYIKEFETTKIKSPYDVYYKRYTENSKNNIEDLHYDIEKMKKLNIDYIIYHDLIDTEYFKLYLFPDTQAKVNRIRDNRIGIFYISTVAEKESTKKRNIEKN